MIINENQIYILDDENGVRESLETVLSAEGYDVKSFSNGADFLKHLRQLTFAAPAVCLLDLRLPDINGITAMQKVKERCAETEAIMLTGNPDMNSAIEAVSAGAYAYLLKPYNIEEIQNLLSRIFEKQKLVRENRKMVQELKEWNDKLERTVYQRTLALEESYRKLKTLYEMRSQFISIMSHELRTPATAMMGFADTLLDRWGQMPKEKINEYLRIISQESDRMVLLMSEIFEISRIQEGKLEMDIREVDGPSYLGELVQDFRQRYPSYAFGYKQGAQSVKIAIDPVHGKTALSYVLMNAVKYSPSGGNILVLAEPQEGKFCARIEDDGPGIPEELREKVFEPFYRSMDDINRKTPGAGLGLTIARGLLSGMGGSIRIEPKLTGGKGCAVVVTLPAASSA